MITPLTHSWSRLLGVLLCATVMMCAVAPTITRAEDDADAAASGEAPSEAPEDEADEEADASITKYNDAETAGQDLSEIQQLEKSNDSDKGDVDVLWTCLAAFLVFFMQAGFALVEAGFTRAKNACNIIMKNLMDLSIGTIAFWIVGFGLMFGASSTTGGFIGTTNFFYDAGSDQFNWAFLIFQTVFCATAATIVSGAMAERTKFYAYLLYTLGITIIVYPIFGAWAWGSLLDGGGWLEDVGLYDFAGSTVVHSIGGWCALAGAIVIGPRLGKYNKEGKSLPIPGHNIPIAALGVFILWLGWFGFNAGSTTAVGGGSFAYIAVTTNAAAAAGAIAAMVVSWVLFKKPDVSFALNGALAGLVSITAGCPVLSVGGSLLVGAIGGAICVFAVLAFDRCRIDDPVGAISVHGVCGAWGTLAVGLFACPTAASQNPDAICTGLFYGGGVSQLISQLIGIGAAFVWAFGVSFIIFSAIKYTVGLRASEEEEMEGLDITEHAMHAYPPSIVSADAK